MKKVSLTLNGEKKNFEVYPMARTLDVLREQAGLTGTKEGCGEGECGACAILVNGELVNSCLIPFLQLEEAEVETIESVGTPEHLNYVQEAFLECGGAQCGICTPGMIMAATYLLRRNPHPNLDQIREGVSGNLCRCTGYTKIFESIVRATQKEAAQ